jgi:hypothetical protein
LIRLIIIIQVFQGYNFHFLTNPIESDQLTPVGLSRTKFSFKIKFLQDQDRRHINHLLKKIHPDMKIQDANVYVNGKDTDFLTDSYPSILTTFQEDKKWRIKIVFQGFKTGISGRPTPIWKMKEAQLFSR